MYYHFNNSRDNSINSIATLNHNAGLVMLYPFLLPHNRWTCKARPDYDFTYTALDYMPEGWRKAFSNEMLEELAQLLTDANYNGYHVYSIKEKGGILNCQDSGVPEELCDKYNEWLHKYETKSQETCLLCGDPATVCTCGKINYVCHSCLDRLGCVGIPFTSSK